MSAECSVWLPKDPNVPYRERERCAMRGPHTEHRAGLVGKYHVEKINDPEGKHTECRFFVLDPQHDPLARIALAAYAEAAERVMEDTGHFRRKPYQSLARDLRAWLRRLGDDR